MIDLKTKIVGDKLIAQQLAESNMGVRNAIMGELADIGDEVVPDAQSAAARRTGLMARRIIWFFGRRVRRGRGGQRRMRIIASREGKIQFTAMPTGRVAHLIERGVNATFQQRRRRDLEVRYTRTVRIAPRPFFMPAVEAVGGAAGANDRLQAAIDRYAESV